MKALILAAGKGTRLKELTKDRPKPMIEVGPAPLLEYLVGWLRGHGIREIAINLHHRPQSIVEHFGDGERFGVEIVYSYESQLLGTAGAAKRLTGFLDDQFALVYGDVYTNVDLTRLLDFHREQRRRYADGRPALTLSLYRVMNPTQCGLVALNERGEVTRFVEKPPADQVFTDLANAGLCVVDPELLAYVPSETPYDVGHHLLPKLLQMGSPVYGQEIAGDEYLVDIGTPQGLNRALSMVGPAAATLL